MKKIILLSLALVAGLFVLTNVTKAADALLDLQITAVTWSCTYGKDINLGATPQSYLAFNMTGAFLVTGDAAKWSCNDTAWKAPWNMSISATNLTTTAGTTYTIANSKIELLTAWATQYAWGPLFTGSIWVFTSRGTDLSTTRILFQKTSTAGTVGELWTDNVTLRVLVPVNQEIWSYRSTITIQIPTM